MPADHVKRVEYQDTDNESESDHSSSSSEDEVVVKASKGKRKKSPGSKGTHQIKKTRLPSTSRSQAVQRNQKSQRVHIPDAEELQDEFQVDQRKLLDSARKAKRMQAVGNAFFDIVQKGIQVTNAITAWRNRFESSRTACQSELINFILIAAGAQREWIRQDVNLEELEPVEVYEELTDMIQELKETQAVSSIPLSSSGKQKVQRQFKERYIAFWESFVVVLLPFESSSELHVQTLKSVIHIMMCFSSLPLSNIRFAITLALLTISRKLQQIIVMVRERTELTLRQYEAQEKVSRKSAKFKTFSTMKDECETLLSNLNEMSEEIYTTIFVHRYKDCNEDVRELCANHLGMWIVIDPHSLYSDEYIKYLGWMCSDRAAAVRRAVLGALNALLDHESHVPKLTNFVERFVERFIEMAVGDADDEAAVKAVSLLRRLQHHALLDDVSEEALDLVDDVVFDSGTSFVHRREALAFVFDHTEGFDPHDGGESELEQRQHVTVQLETILEFLEHHLGSDPDIDSINMLVEACCDLPHVRLLDQWPAMITMLLNDHGEQNLSSVHTRTLIKLFLASALRAQANTKKANKRMAQTSEAEQLTECLLNDLPRLLLRFRDDDSNLAMLTRLIACYDTSAVNQKQFKPLMKVICEIYESATDVKILSETAIALRGIILSAEHLRAMVETYVRGMLQRIWGRVFESSTSNDGDEDDVIFEISACLHRLTFLWQQIDCRLLISSDYLEEFSDGLINVSERLIESCGLEKASVSLYWSSCQNVSKIIFSLVLWSSRDVFNFAKTIFADGEGNALDHDISVSVKLLLSERDKLVNLLHSWLDLQEGVLSPEFVGQLHFEAFRIISDMRVLFTSRIGMHRIVGELVWSPPKELLECMRRTFETQGNYLALKLRSLGESNEEKNAGDAFAADLINGLIVPMGIATVYDIERLNRRQAASVLCHFLDQNDRLQSFIRAWAKRLKDFDPIKYLEVQLLALKTAYSDLILTALQLEDDFDHSTRIKDGYKTFESLAFKLAQTFGVGKFKGEMLSALRELMKMGIDFAFNDISNLGFFRGLVAYLRFLPPGEMKLIQDNLENRVEMHESLKHDVADERNASSEVQALIEFRDTVGGSKRVTRRRRKTLDSSIVSRSSASSQSLGLSVAHSKDKNGHKFQMMPVPEEHEGSNDESIDSDHFHHCDSAFLKSSQIEMPGTHSPILASLASPHEPNNGVRVQRKYSSRVPSTINSTPEINAPGRSSRKIPDYVLGLHLEDVSPVPSDESGMPLSQAEQDIDEMFAQIKRLPKRRNRIS